VTRLSSIGDLKELRDLIGERLAELAKKIEVKIHLGSCGIASGARSVQETFLKEAESRKLSNVVITEAACIGPCGREPIVTVIHPKNGRMIYAEVTPERVPTIIERHLIGGEPIPEWTLDLESPTFRLQKIRILHNQDIDPTSVEEYIARDGYQALAKVLTQMRPEEVINEVSRSGLRGRGGAGFPTATKWTFVRQAAGDEKFVICNADEGDPGAYMNRAVLEGNPHSILEGMLIGAYAIGATRGYIYCRAEKPLAIERLDVALRQAAEYGLMGDNILGSDFSFQIELRKGAGAFVCGEETALLASIEGRRGNPRQRPPFPAHKGLFNKPTVLNNVETWSNIPLIILNGAEWFASVGSDKSKGTKTFCLVGKISNPGLIEVPLGTPLGQVVFDIGGGCPGGRQFKAVQIGGPSGGCIPIAHLNTPIDYESVTALGAIMGSGGLIVMDENNCMVDVARFFLQFTKDESCGKCTPCRAGISKMLDILTKISQGKGAMEDLDTLTELAEMVGSASLCGLGQTAPNPVLTTLRHFRDEYEAHIIDKHCPAAVCQALFTTPCQHTCPVELDCSGYIALVKAGKFADAYKLIKQRLPFPMSVGRVCDHPCEVKCRRVQVDEAVSIRDLKRIAADYAYEHGVEFLPPVKPRKPERVAIVGAGPAGLTAAYELARDGYAVTIFEALPVAGGMMAVAIPEYRLPKGILNAEIEGILKLGVELRLNTRVDDIEVLFDEGYKAIFISCGAHKGGKMGIPGEDAEGVYDAIEFLRAISLGKKPKVGRKVAVVGGGNSAIDAARASLRLGADEVRILYRRERKDMPAIWEEIEAAEAEGIRIDCLTALTKVLSTDGKASGLECIRMELKEFDSSGRRTPYPVAGSGYTILVDTVIEAIGQRPDASFIKDNKIKIGRGGTIVADPRTLATTRSGVFAGGDAVTGPKTVIWAVAAGQRAASSIKRYLQGKPLSPFIERDGYEPIEVPKIPPTEDEVKVRSRVYPSHIDPREQKSSFKEIVFPFTPEEAKAEASRCLRCDLEAAEEGQSHG